jgi:hypothetical protein
VRADAVRFEVLPGVAVDILGDDATMRHFHAEYGVTRVPLPGDSTASMRVTVVLGGPRSAPIDERGIIVGSHKTVSWRAVVGPPDHGRIDATITLRGRPQWFGLSLIQGYIIEPLISVAAAAAGGVLLPAAAIVVGPGATVLLGRSRSGKSSVSARAAAAGLPVLGDDQVHVDRAGMVSRFPRRFRFYDDLSATAPDAYRRLPARARRALAIRRIIRIASLGFVAPSLPVPVSDLGAVVAPATGISRIVVLERVRRASRVELGTLTPGEAAETAMGILDDQRRHLGVLGETWRTFLGEIRHREADVLRDLLTRVTVERMLIPEALGPAAAVDAVWQQLLRAVDRRDAPESATEVDAH